MNPKIPLSTVNILGLFLVLVVLYFSTLYNFLLFHTLAEFFSIVVAFAIFSELAFTFYVGVYDLSNIIGHFFKFISFYLIYKALVETGLKEPYEFLFKELTDSEEKYRTLFTNMLNGVAYHKVVLDENNLPVDHLFLDVNDAFEKLLGLSKKDINKWDISGDFA